MELKEFYKINNTEGMERSMIWDASNKYTRGLKIQYRIISTKDRNKNIMT